MSAVVVVILPVGLFRSTSICADADAIYLVEDPVYFTKYRFHKQKLVLHRASMQRYFDVLKSRYEGVRYVPFNKADYKRMFAGAGTVRLHDPVDHDVMDVITQAARGRKLDVLDTPAFLETREELHAYWETTNRKNYFHDASFYRWQRRRLDVLMQDGKPRGGKWSFDRENRKPFPADYAEAALRRNRSEYVEEAKRYVAQHFPDNFGDSDSFVCPIDHTAAKRWLATFIRQRLPTFGPHQDAASSKVVLGSHSLLSPLLNIGLLTPAQVLEAVLDAKDVDLQSVEAFVRQLIGWRSFVRMVYVYHGRDMLAMNRLGQTASITPHWYEGTTGIQPVDVLIRRAKQYGYLHHIERLMYMGNFFLLCEVRPTDVYEWFMVCFLDSYAWVMMANVLGMSQFALEGVSMMTRPYFSSSSYLKRMSDFTSGEWQHVWDALYYRFLKKHRTLLKRIYATAPQVRHLDRKPAGELKAMLAAADRYLAYLK